MKGPRALMAAIAAFAASWRFSNGTVRDSDHRNKEDIKTKTVEIKIKVFWHQSYPPPWCQTQPAAPEECWPPPRWCEGLLEKPQGGS